MVSLLLFLFQFGFAQDEKPMADPDTFKEKLTSVSQKTSSIQCNYIQKKHLSFSKNPLESNGRMCFQDENMRWEQTDPDDYIFVINGETLTIKEDGVIKERPLNQNKMMKGIKEIFIGSMTGSLFDSDQFETAFYANDKSSIVKLTPKSKRLGRMFSEIKMYFNPKTYRLEFLFLIEGSGDYTELQFTNAVYDQKISRTQFIIE